MLFPVRYWLIVFILIAEIIPGVSRAAVPGARTSSLSTPVVEKVVVSSSISDIASSSTSSIAAADFIVGTRDVARAFTRPEQASSTGERFQGPVQYFRVGERLTREEAPRDCDDCDNLVAIFVSPVMPTSTPAWVAAANPEIRRSGGRLQIRWFAANRVIIVTAPGTVETVTALGSWLRERAILGKIN